MTTDPVRVEDTTENMAWGDNFIEINGVWYSKRDTNYTRCNTCEDPLGKEKSLNYSLR